MRTFRFVLLAAVLLLSLAGGARGQAITSPRGGSAATATADPTILQNQALQGGILPYGGTGLNFAVAQFQRVIQPVGLVVSDSTTSNQILTSGAGHGTLTLMGSKLKYTVTSSGMESVSTGALLKGSAVGSYITVTQQSSAGTGLQFGTGYGGPSSAVGISSNNVFTYYKVGSNLLGIRDERGGADAYATEVSVTLTPPYQIGFTQVGRYAGAWVNKLDGAGWQQLIQFQVQSSNDLRTPSVLAGAYPCWLIGSSSVGDSATISQIVSGYCGATGLRELMPVTWQDGTPYQINGQYAVLVDMAMVSLINNSTTTTGLAGLAAVHLGVWLYDATQHLLTQQIGEIFMAVNGRNIAAQNANCMFDGKDFWFYDSDWSAVELNTGNGNDVYYQQVHGDLMHGVHVLTPTKLSLPGTINSGSGTDYSDYDCSVRKVGSLWYAAVSVTPTRTGYNAGSTYLFSGTAPATFTTQIGHDSTVSCETSELIQCNGITYVINGKNVAGTSTFRVSNLSMTYLGNLNFPATTNTNFASYIGWLPANIDGTTVYQILGMRDTTMYSSRQFGVSDGCSFGDAMFLDMTQSPFAGLEHPVRATPYK